jgi:hypothetical protein
MEQVTQVDVYQNSSLLEKYEFTKRSLEASQTLQEEVLVFHATATHNIEPIMTTGFLIGGVDVPVVNGQSLGQGIYTSINPSIAMRYAAGSNAVILAKGLRLLEQKIVTSSSASRASSSMQPHPEDIVVFRERGLLLPQHVIHFKY